jgi:flagellar biosynthesis protein FlhF
MRIKSYFAGSVEEAMEKARRELGPDAMLMNSKKTEIELRSLGAYEVVFAIAPEEVRPPDIRPFRVPSVTPAPAVRATAPVPARTLAATPSARLVDGPVSALPEFRETGNDLARELAELRKQIETVKRSVDRRPEPQAKELGTDGADLLDRLATAEFSSVMAGELAAAAENMRTQQGRTEMGMEAALRAECERRLRFSPSLGPAGAEPRAVLLVGPAGVGKTTTLVKLAFRYGLRDRLPVQMLSLDTLRIGGWEQLACYSRIAGIPCQPVHTPAALDAAFAEHRQKKLLLIDTPGFSAAEPPSRSLAGWLSSHRQFVEVHLVLSAAAQPRINLSMIERFAPFAPAKLLFTHLDEAETSGPVLETALRAGLPLSFLATGQQVPEDLEEASLDRLFAPLAATGGTAGRRIASAA